MVRGSGGLHEKVHLLSTGLCEAGNLSAEITAARRCLTLAGMHPRLSEAEQAVLNSLYDHSLQFGMKLSGKTVWGCSAEGRAPA